MLHAFAKRTSPSRFRRLSTLRFQQIHPRVRRDYKVNLRTHELTGALRRRRLLAHKLSRVAYLTPTWRELLAYRVESPIVLPTVDFTSTEVTAPRTSLASATNTAVAYPEQYGQPFGATTKRRFAALPLNRLFKRAQTVQRILRSKNLISLRTQRIGLLRTALRLRRVERAYLDLKKHTWRRRLPKEQLPPPWKNRKRARKHEEHMRYGDWSPRHFAFSQSKAIFWTLDALEDRVPRRRDRAPTAIQRSYHNEILTLPPATIKRANWARKGFRIKSVGKKAKRLRRSEKRRHRRARGKISKERRARFHHWSERKNFNQIRTVGKFGGTAFFRKVRIAVKKPNRGWRRRLLQTHKRIRSPLTSTSRHARMHSVNRRAVSDVIGSVNASGPTSLSSAVLPSFSSIVRPKRVNILKRRTAYRRNKFLRRQFAAIQRATRRNAAQPSALVSARVQAERALRRFTENLTNVSILTPLAFQRPTRLVVKTDAEKKRAVFWNIQSKERRYKRTAQYAESLAHYIPALISHMIAQRIKNRNLTYKRAKTLIHATYWNLRVYLNVDPFEKRLALRDNNFGLLRRLAKEVAVLAKEQLTEHADRTRLRQRFQPKRVHPAPTSDRFRLDWLRAFFPRKHALFQEDPEEYRVIPVSTRNIRHLIPTAQGIEVSQTAPKFPNLERRARRLLRLRLSRRDSRLETVLQTTRRVPLTEVDTLLPPVVEETAEMKKEAEALAAMQLAAAEAAASVYVRSKKFVFVKKGRNLKPAADPFEVAGLNYLFNEGTPTQMGLSVHRTSFFQRGFSTATNRVAGSLARYISRHNRLLILSNQRIPTFTAVSARYRLKGRTEARGRSHFTASARWMIDTGSTDPRFLRYKSPRSRQYIVRLPSYLARKSDMEKTIKFLSYRKIRENLEAIAPGVNKEADSEQLTRVNRRHFYNEFVPTLTPVIDAALAATRAIVLPRRWPTVLHARADVLRYEIGQTENYNFPNRQQLTFVPFSFHEQAHALQANEAIAPILDLDAHQLAPYTRKTYGARRVVNRARSILQYRTASQRSIDRVYRAERVLHRQAISLKAASFTRGSMGRRAFRFLDSVANGALFQRRLLRFSVPTRRDRYKRNVALAARAVRVARSKVRVLRRNYRRIFQVRGRAQTQYSRLRNNAGAKFATSFHSRRLGAAIVGKLAPTARRFRITAYKRLALGRRLRKRCARLLRIRRRAIFDTSRPRLWHEVTHRWMKKHRFMREWLKNVKHWFRDPWLSQTVDVRTPSLGNLPPGVIRAREQQDGEVVDGDENIGFTKEEARAREKAALPAIALAKEVVVADKRRALAATKGATAEQKLLIIARKMLSKPALLKPRPTMWLANLQARELMAENTLRWTKTRKEKDEVRLAEKNAAIERAKNKLPPLPPKKDPLKVPANSFMPPVVWKEIQRRARQLEWRESDDVFRRSGFRMAFRFYPSERNRAPWLESLMYNRSLFSTRLHEFRRRQYPREQKKYKWLQRVRKSLFPGRTNVYIKGRRWPRIRMYNQRLHYTLFNLPNRSAARRHFKKLNRRSRKVGFVHAQEGLSNRLDNVLIHLNIVPTIFWARVVAPHGLLRVNGVIVKDMNYRFKAGDFIEPVWERICRFRHYFKTPLNRNEESKRPKRFSVTGVPRNFRYYPSLRCYSYLGNPREGDLRRSSRLQPHLFRWFKLDSV
jgi:ribosomal protein S4